MITLPLYIVSLSASSCVVGLFVRRILASQGFAPDFYSGLVLAAGAALAFMAVQLIYMSFVRFVTPSRGPLPFVAEIASHLSALILVPFFLSIPIPWPDMGSENIMRLLVKVEPLVFIGAFVVAHLFFKLLALFGATQSRPASRFPVLGWSGAAFACVLGAMSALGLWQTALVDARTNISDDQRLYRIGGAWAQARQMQEGYYYPLDLSNHGGKPLVLRWAQPPQAPALSRVEVSFRFEDGAAPPFHLECTLEANRWNELRIPAGQIPLNVNRAQIRWSSATESAFLARTGIQSVNSTEQTLLSAGPYVREPRAATEDPNFIVLLLDGVSGEHFKSLDYDRDAAPNLDAFAAEGLSYRYAYTPAPETPAAAMSLLSGALPLAHGILGDRTGPLPEGMRLLPELLRERGYVTAAFTEGENGGGLTVQTPFSRGFELYDDTYPLHAARRAGAGVLPGGVEPPDPARTLNKALDFAREQKSNKYFAFVRIRDLEEIRELSRYATPFPAGRRNRLPIDHYDNALYSLDATLKRFLDNLEEEGLTENTVVVITSSYGHTFAGNEPGQVTLEEASLRVPLFIRGPRQPARQRLGIVGLEDVATTLANLAGMSFPHAVSGDNLLEWSSRDRIAIQGDPAVLSLRTKDWRFTWASGQSPFTLAASDQPETVLSFINMDRYRLGRRQDNNVQAQPELVAEFSERLRNYLEQHGRPEAVEPALAPAASEASSQFAQDL